MNNTELNQQIKTIENKIIETKSALKIWAQQISQYHKALKELTKQLETIKPQITMNENNIKQNENNKLNNIKNNSQNNQGGTK